MSVCLAWLKAMLVKKIGQASITLARGLLEAIEAILELAHMVRIGGMHNTCRLLHICLHERIRRGKHWRQLVGELSITYRDDKKVQSS